MVSQHPKYSTCMKQKVGRWCFHAKCPEPQSQQRIPFQAYSSAARIDGRARAKIRKRGVRCRPSVPVVVVDPSLLLLLVPACVSIVYRSTSIATVKTGLTATCIYVIIFICTDVIESLITICNIFISVHAGSCRRSTVGRWCGCASC